MSVTADPVQLRSCIAGEWIDGHELVLDLNPSRPDDVIAEVALADGAMARDAVTAAATAFDGWRRTPAPQRGEILRRAGDLLDRRADEGTAELAWPGEVAGDGRRERVVVQAEQRQLPEPVRPEQVVRLEREQQPLEVVDAVERRHRAGQRAGGRAEDPADARPQRAEAQALQEAELHQHPVDAAAGEDDGDVPFACHVAKGRFGGR